MAARGLPRKLPLPGPRQESAYHDNYIGKTNGTDTGYTLKRSRTKMYCTERQPAAQLERCNRSHRGLRPRGRNKARVPVHGIMLVVEASCGLQRRFAELRLGSFRGDCIPPEEIVCAAIANVASALLDGHLQRKV